MNLYEELVLYHYRLHTKNQTPDVSMRIACLQAYEAIQSYSDSEQLAAMEARRYYDKEKKRSRDEMVALCAQYPQHAEQLEQEFLVEWKHYADAEKGKSLCDCRHFTHFNFDCVLPFEHTGLSIDLDLREATA